jgi:hypothetical protein
MHSRKFPDQRKEDVAPQTAIQLIFYKSEFITRLGTENWTAIQNLSQIINLLQETGQQLETILFRTPGVPAQNLCPVAEFHS